MDEVLVGLTKTLTVPNTAETVTIVHEWGKSVSDSCSATYDWTPDSIGVHKIIWADVDEATVSTEFYSAYVPIIDKDSFTTDYPAFASLTDEDIYKAEKLVRPAIQNFTGHKFGPYIDQMYTIQGDGGESLVLPFNVLRLTGIEDVFGTDLTELVQVSPNQANIVQAVARFKGSRYFSVKEDVSFFDRDFFDESNIFILTGDFGWEYVPVDVSNAAGVLLSESLSGSEASELRAQGIYEAQIGDFSMKISADSYGTTGSSRADLLLSSYVYFGVGLV